MPSPHHHGPADHGSASHSPADDWDERYSGEQLWSGNPNQALVTELAALAAEGVRPGSALDLGCGEGADSVWLAQQGWQVLALDISGNAVQRTVKAAECAGVHVTGMAQPFLQALLAQPFDLVSAMFPVLAKTPEKLAERRLLELVAPGGSLLFVHHGDIDVDEARSHGFDPTDFLAVADIAAVVEADPDWELLTHDRRERHVTGGNGAGHSVDEVLRARRLR